MKKKHSTNITDTNIKSLKDLLRKDGKLNVTLISNKEFPKLKIYADILSKTKELNVFPNITIGNRILFLLGQAKISYCSKCNLPRISFPTIQKQISLCKHHTLTTEGYEKIKHKNNNISRLIHAYSSNKNLILSNDEFNEIVIELSTKNKNYNFLITDKLFDFYHDLLIKTSIFIPVDEKRLHLSKRFFCVKNDITKIPKCKFCNNNECTYINAVVGFLDSCPSCSNLKLEETLTKKIQQECIDKIDSSKYEILHTPSTLNNDELIIRCKKCKAISRWKIHNGLLNKLQNLLLCKSCEKVKSKPEELIVKFISEISNDKIIHTYGSRKIIPPYELDIYIPKRKIAFEFDGLYWHSIDDTINTKSDRTYHLKKTELCEEKGIKLIHIFEDEWNHKNEIVKSRIKNLFGIYDTTVFARKCCVKEVDLQISKQFQEDNHIQGAVNSKVNLGLYYNDELISLMTFGKCRFDKKHEWELLRFCNKLGYHIPGGASKLLKYFERNYKPKSLVSYADRRWSQGKLYSALDFKLDHISEPNYWYLDGNFDIRYDRMKFQKHKLKDILDTFDATISESQNMKNNGYTKIYDCGNLVFVKHY